MSHAAREPTDRLHLGRLSELLFQSTLRYLSLFSRGNVAERGEDPEPVAEANGYRARFDHELPTRAMHHRQLCRRTGHTLQAVTGHRTRDWQRVLAEEPQLGHGFADHFVPSVAEHLFRGTVDVDEHAVAGHELAGIRRRLEEHAKALFALTQRRFGGTSRLD